MKNNSLLVLSVYDIFKSWWKFFFSFAFYHHKMLYRKFQSGFGESVLWYGGKSYGVLPGWIIQNFRFVLKIHFSSWKWTFSTIGGHYQIHIIVLTARFSNDFLSLNWKSFMNDTNSEFQLFCLIFVVFIVPATGTLNTKTVLKREIISLHIRCGIS